jgi:hypothetical protein
MARNPNNFVLMKFQLDSGSDMHFRLFSAGSGPGSVFGVGGMGYWGWGIGFEVVDA